MFYCVYITLGWRAHSAGGSGRFWAREVMSTSRRFGTTTMQARTPGFQSPEQLRGESMGIACDIFALGAVLTELFEKKPIWEGQNNCSIIYFVAHEGKMPQITHLPPEIKDIIGACLCPASTRASAATILHQLCALLWWAGGHACPAEVLRTVEPHFSSYGTSFFNITSVGSALYLYYYFWF